MRSPKFNYWKAHKPVHFIFSYVLSVTQQYRQRIAWKASLQSFQPLQKMRRMVTPLLCTPSISHSFLHNCVRWRFAVDTEWLDIKIDEALLVLCLVYYVMKRVWHYRNWDVMAFKYQDMGHAFHKYRPRQARALPGHQAILPYHQHWDSIKSREITNTYSSKMIAFPVKLQLCHASFPAVALKGTFPWEVIGSRDL